MELTSTTNMEVRLNKDGKFEIVKSQDAVQVFYIKSLSFDGTTLHHEGVMLLTEPKSHNKNKPIYFIPYWNPDKEILEKLEISEKQIKKSVLLGKRLCIDVSESKGKKRVKVLFVDLQNDDEIDKLHDFLPPHLKPRRHKVAEGKLAELPFLTAPLEKLEEAPLVKQYVKFMTQFNGWIYDNFKEWKPTNGKEATPVRRFRKILDGCGGTMHNFLKSQVGFQEDNSLANMLTKYVKAHKCSIQDCPNFSKMKCGKCKTAVYCSVDCQKNDFDIHSNQYCAQFKNHHFNRVKAFRTMITEIISSNTENSNAIEEGNLTMDDFCARIKPWVLSGYMEYIVNDTFLLGSIKFSSKKYSSIDIREGTETLKPLLKFGKEKFDANTNDIMTNMYEKVVRAWFFKDLLLMKKLYLAGELDTSKINSGEWLKEFNTKDEKYKKRFEDEEPEALMSQLSKMSPN